jgi:hypothetical protein
MIPKFNPALSRTYANLSAFPTPGEDGFLYRAEDTGALYLREGGEYKPLAFSGPLGPWAPDYAHLEGTNRITTNNGTWTADRDGFVRVTIQAMTNASALCAIDNAIVGQNYSGTDPAHSQAFLSDVYPVSVGNVVKLYVDAGSATNISCRFIPPKPSALGADLSLVNSLLTLGPPNFSMTGLVAHRPDVPLVGGGTMEALDWTADREGYVIGEWHGDGTQSPNVGNAWYREVMMVNSVTVSAHFIWPASVGTTSTYVELFRMHGVVPVKKGQLVRLELATSDSHTFSSLAPGLKIYFIPPVINPPLYVPGQPLVSYSTRSQDTGVKWLDGKAIYQQTFIGPALPNSADTSDPNNYVAIVGNIVFDKVISIEGGAVWNNGAFETISGGWKDMNTGAMLDLVRAYVRSNGQVVFAGHGSDGRTIVESRVTVRYTKP